MRGEQAADAFGEIHVAGFGRPRTGEPRAEHGRTDSLERPGDPLRIPRELHRRGVGQILPLPRDRRLDEIAEEHAEETEHHHHQPDEQQIHRRRRYACDCRRH